MALLTANAQDLATLRGLRCAGAVTVLVALLANESGAVQELACATLANLLVTPPGPAAATDLCPRRMVHQCNGRVPLAALLTSPGARLSTVSSVPLSASRSGATRGDMHRASTWVHSSTFCMGMASKHAARALCNLWCPQHAIGRSMVEGGGAVPWAQHDDEGGWPRLEPPSAGLAYFDRLRAVGTDAAWPQRSQT